VVLFLSNLGPFNLPNGGDCSQGLYATDPGCTHAPISPFFPFYPSRAVGFRFLSHRFR